MFECNKLFYTRQLIFCFAALSILQNGEIPTFIGHDHLQELFNSESPSLYIANLRKGMNSLGLCKVMYDFLMSSSV